jgi:hypothetical protein
MSNAREVAIGVGREGPEMSFINAVFAWIMFHG